MDDDRQLKGLCTTRNLAVGINKEFCNHNERIEALTNELSVYKMITNNMTDIVNLVDREGILVFVNPSDQNILGYEPSERLGSSVFRNIHPEEKEMVQSEFRKCINENVICKAVFRLQDVNKYFRWFEATGKPIFDKSGSVTGAVIVARDITDRKNTEDQLKQSENKYRLLAENARDVIGRVKFQPHPHFEYISPSVKDITGFSPEELYKDCNYSAT